MKLTKEECEGIISLVRAASTITAGVSQEEVEAMSAQVEREDSIAPLIDPTGWMRTKDKSDNWRRLWTAFRKFREEVLQVQEDEMKRMEKAQQQND